MHHPWKSPKEEGYFSFQSSIMQVYDRANEQQVANLVLRGVGCAEVWELVATSAVKPDIRANLRFLSDILTRVMVNYMMNL